MCIRDRYIACALTISDFEIVSVVTMLIWIDVYKRQEAERPLHLCLRSGFDHISDTSAKCDHVSVHLSDCCSTNLDDLQKITEKYSQNRKGKRTEVSKEPSGSSGKG